MASEAVQFIRDEEKAAAARLTEAQARCARIQAEAKEKISALQAVQQAQAAQQAAELHHTAVQQAAQARAVQQAELDTRIAALRAQAAQRRETAVRAVMDRLAGQ